MQCMLSFDCQRKCKTSQQKDLNWVYTLLSSKSQIGRINNNIDILAYFFLLTLPQKTHSFSCFWKNRASGTRRLLAVVFGSPSASGPSSWRFLLRPLASIPGVDHLLHTPGGRRLYQPSLWEWSGMGFQVRILQTPPQHSWLTAQLPEGAWKASHLPRFWRQCPRDTW